jgi:hypothetical protein
MSAGAAELLGVPVSAAVPLQRHNPRLVLAVSLAELAALAVLIATASLSALALLVAVSLALALVSATNQHRVLAITAHGHVALSASARGWPRAVVGPVPGDLELPDPRGVGQPVDIGGVRWWVDRSAFAQLRHARGLLEADGQDDGREGEDHRRQDGDAVEVALDHGGPRRRRPEAAAEHLRQPAPSPAVQEDQEDEGD